MSQTDFSSLIIFPYTFIALHPICENCYPSKLLLKGKSLHTKTNKNSIQGSAAASGKGM
jgi:hypothetical protein